MGTATPSVFDAGLPTLSYDLTASPLDIRDDVREARRRHRSRWGRSARRSCPMNSPGTFCAMTGFAFRRGSPWPRKASPPVRCTTRWPTACWARRRTAHAAAQLVAKAFTPRATSRLQDTIHEVVDGLIDQVESAGRCDVVTDIARPYPTPVMCALLGAPRDDWQLFADWTEEVFQALNFKPEVTFDEAAIMRAWNELDAYVDEMVDARRHTLTEDLLSELIRAESDGDRLTLDELRMLVAGFLMAGTDTTRNQLAASVQVLCEHPDQWTRLRDHPN